MSGSPYAVKQCASMKCNRRVSLFFARGHDKLKFACQHCNKIHCETCTKRSSCQCGFICKPCRQILYTRECFACDICERLLCQKCVTKICTQCSGAYCDDCEYGNMSTCDSCGENKCNYCMTEIPNATCLDCMEDE